MPSSVGMEFVPRWRGANPATNPNTQNMRNTRSTVVRRDGTTHRRGEAAANSANTSTIKSTERVVRGTTKTPF